MSRYTLTRFSRSVAAAAMLAAGYGLVAGPAEAAPKPVKFKMVRSAGLPYNCLPNASANVKVTPVGQVEQMDIDVKGLLPYTEYDLFVIQVPGFPFGMSWYQADIETDGYGNGHLRTVGRFNEETFVIAPGSASAPYVHAGDAQANPPTNGAIHTYHLGLWFNSPEDAARAGCPDFTTPFNGEHDAGVQILNTGNYPDLAGPLKKVK